MEKKNSVAATFIKYDSNSLFLCISVLYIEPNTLSESERHKM